MAKLKPIRLKEVVYTLSPFEQSIMSGLWKHGPQNFVKLIKEVKQKSFLRIMIFLYIARLQDHGFPYSTSLWNDCVSFDEFSSLQNLFVFVV